jgi:hypothetical protein
LNRANAIAAASTATTATAAAAAAATAAAVATAATDTAIAAAATTATATTGGPKEAVASGLRSQDDASYANDTLALQFFKGASPQQQQVPVMLNCQAKVCATTAVY